MVEYYGNNDYRDYLMHYGVKGMKWGKHLKKKAYEVKDYVGDKIQDVKRRTTPEYKLAKENNRQNNLRGAGKTFLQKDRMGEPERPGATKAYMDYFKGHGYGRIKEIPGTNGAVKVRLNKKGRAQANSEVNAINAHKRLKFEKNWNRIDKEMEESRREFQEEWEKRKKRR